MRKIPTIFERDPETNFRTLTKNHHPECEWVFDGEGVATRKFDGTCCLIEDGVLYKRREVKAGKEEPPLFRRITTDKNTGKSVGWVPVSDKPQDKFHREAMKEGLTDGTYELVGPKIQGNPEGYSEHVLLPHGEVELVNAPRDFDALQGYLKKCPFEGVVWHHPDGRMCKIKRKDFWLSHK